MGALNGSAARQRLDPPRAGRTRDAGTARPPDDTTVLEKPGFAEEALPWLDAVHRFALRLTRNESDADDLMNGVQEVARFETSATIDRRDFGVGVGNWAATMIVAKDIDVRIAVEANHK